VKKSLAIAHGRQVTLTKTANKASRSGISVKTVVNTSKQMIPVRMVTKEPSTLFKNLLENAIRFNPTKLFVLDTNVLIHDPMSLFYFEEHDVFIPMMVLEELDANKRGTSEASRSARQASRTLDEIVAGSGHISMKDGIEFSVRSQGQATGRLFFQTEPINGALPAMLPIAKADNQIIGVALYLKEKYPKREVILVSKDINMRIKAMALGLTAQDNFNDQALEDIDLLYTGTRELPSNFWETCGENMKIRKEAGHTFYAVKGRFCSGLHQNEFVWQDGDKPFRAIVCEQSGQTATLKTFRDYMSDKNKVWNITARNREQSFALELLMNPDIDFVTLSGQAGTGKTLLTLAAALDQTLNKRLYNEIIFTRVTVPVGEDIAFLPGTEEEKMNPWMGALDDNFEILTNGETSHLKGWARGMTNDVIRSYITVKSLNFMRGRTFIGKIIIIDETQNLTPKQMKTLITRAGPGTKVVCLGNIAQIDTPYLTEGSSGLTYIVERFKGWPYSGHVTLSRGERSRLADYATEVL